MSAQHPLPTSAISNARWLGIIQLARIGTQLLSLTLLSRMLSPADFGLVAMATVASNFAMLLRDMGTAAALIRRRELDEGILTSAFWMNCLAGVALGAGLALAAPAIAAGFAAPEVRGLLTVMAIAFPISALSIVQQALLERAGRFAVVARIEIVAVLAGFCVALLAARLGGGPYSLVLQTLCIACATTLQLWLNSSWRPSRSWGRRELQELWRFGGHISGFNVVNYFARNADSMIIGRALGAVSLGPYSLALRIMLFPLYNLTFVATRALLPVMSRRQDQPRELGELYLRTVAAIAFFTAPLMAGLFVLREPFVSVFLGERWSSVADLIVWLAPVGFVQSLVSPSGSVLTSLGRTDLLWKLGLACTALQVAAFLAGVQWGVLGVARCYLAASVLTAALWMAAALRLLERNAGQLLARLQQPVAMALLMAACIHFTRVETPGLLSERWQLGLFVCSGALLYFGLARIAARALERDVRRIFQ